MDGFTPLWRRGFDLLVPLLPRAGLERLAVALRDDDPRLVQKVTADFRLKPGRLTRLRDADGRELPTAERVRLGDVELCGCFVAFPFLAEASQLHPGDQLAGLVVRFERVINSVEDDDAGRSLGYQHAQNFLDWFDDTPRAQMRAELLPALEEFLASTADPEELADVPAVVCERGAP